MSTPQRNPLERRALLGSIAVGAIGGIAGCLDESEDGSGDDSSDEPEPVSTEEDAAWQTTSLTDVRTDEEFTLGEFDHPLFLHTFSTGCATCHSQHYEFEEFYEQAEGDVEIVDVTTDVGASPDDIRTYAEDDDYEWRFAIAEEEVIEGLVSDVGRDVTNSARSPVVMICPDGESYRYEKRVDADEFESMIDDEC
ncbi:hypothetical protein SAMN04487967_0533 [Natronorubrum sediminis]|uniref:Thioredoxin domain-containing protein n=1 Tax=Natronorubrum sediminis TaxID=640943 RepID=A0A1H6FLV0_9EURY|nr:hypothetical protein [Natronorubrum sediminis]SEH11826.1 hypothetical protein SAMN04487967_0533 [Natronorubrum sediminis]